MAVSQRSDKDHWQRMHAQFRWAVPEHFNIAAGLLRALGAGARRRRGASPSARTAWRARPPSASARCRRRPTACPTCWLRWACSAGDRVALVMPQRFETAIAYMAIFQLGAVAMPLSMLFGPEALEYRLQDSERGGGDRATRAPSPTCWRCAPACPALRTVIGVGAAALQADLDWGVELAQQPPAFTAARTKADEGAVLIYTSGTTGPPKGALIPHRALIGNLPGFVCSQNWFGFRPDCRSCQPSPSPRGGGLGEGAVHDGQAPSAGDAQNTAVFWSPADWAWTGGLMDALLPTLYFGRPIVAYNGRFSPEHAFALMQEHGVTHTFLFPTALKAMMKACPQPRRAVPPQAAGHHERRRGGGRRGVRVLPRRAGRGRQRDVRPDRDQLRGRQLRHERPDRRRAWAGRRAPAAWAGPIPATASR